MLPIEILGILPANRNAIHQSVTGGSTCPFSGESCIKKNRTCTVGNEVHRTVAICPNRFLQNNLVFQQIADEYFGHRHDLLLFGEVASGDSVLGKFDYVMARHRPISNKIEDFVIVEFQTVDTTNTGKLNIESTTTEQLLKAFSGNVRIPSKDIFMANLTHRAKRGISISVNWK